MAVANSSELQYPEMAVENTEAKTIPFAELKPGMILAQPVFQGKTVLVNEGFIVTEKLIARFDGAGVTEVSIRIQAGKKETQAAPAIPLSVKNLISGDYVCFQNDPSTHIYMLEEGELEVIIADGCDTVSPEILEQKGRVVAKLSGRKVTFGEIGAILGTVRTASIRAATPSRVTMIPTSSRALLETVKNNPKLGLSIAISLTGRLKETNGRIAALDRLLKSALAKVEYSCRVYLALCVKLSEKRSLPGIGKWVSELHEDAKRSPYYTKAIMMAKKKTPEPFVEKKPEELLDLGIDLSNIKDFDTGEIICREGEEGREMYILASGRLGVFVGEQRVATISRKGSVIGEIAVLLGYRTGRYEKRTATIRTITASQLVVVPGDNLEDYLQKDPDIIAHIAKELAERLPQTNSGYMNTRNELVRQLENLNCSTEFTRFVKAFEADADRIRQFPEEYKLSSLMAKKIFEEYAALLTDFHKLEG
ncbi:MAG: cyclic nucleotide-binding domain-containing protein [Candidatus Wallbacteria bacterium]|nr:cyclic nucleotide-binding domain-containing protein [Candidatus Wallbacteria bacterium]